MRYEGNLTDHSGNLLSHIYCWINTHVFYTFKLACKLLGYNSVER